MNNLGGPRKAKVELQAFICSIQAVQLHGDTTGGKKLRASPPGLHSVIHHLIDAIVYGLKIIHGYKVRKMLSILCLPVVEKTSKQMLWAASCSLVVSAVTVYSVHRAQGRNP